MVVRLRYENTTEIGCYALLTNSYCLTGRAGSESFHSVFEAELEPHGLPVIRTSVAEMSLVGRLCVGNKHGLLVPVTITDSEMQHLRNSLPDSVKIQKLEERLNALGNVIVCNDYVALIHPQVDRETEEIIQDVLKVETFRAAIAGNELVGSYTILTNVGGLVHSHTSLQEMEEMSNLLQLPLTAGTVNRGSEIIASGIVANDWCAFVGMDCTATEVGVVEAVFKLSGDGAQGRELRDALVESLV